jgi:hypothetical protein
MSMKRWQHALKHNFVFELLRLPIPNEYKCLGLVPSSATNFVVSLLPKGVTAALFGR